MSTRNGLLGLAGILVAGGAAVAKPPGLPAPSHVEGREPTPIAREFHEADVPPPAFGARPVFPARSVGPKPAAPAPLADFVTGLFDVMLNRLTVPLGAAEVRD